MADPNATLLHGADSESVRHTASPIKIVVETVVPMRKINVECTPDHAVGSLAARFMEALRHGRRTASVSRPHGQTQSAPTAVRLIYDGVFLDEHKSMRASGLVHDSRVIAVAHRAAPAHALPAAIELASHWWPLLCACGITVGLLALAATEAAECARPLWSFVCVGAPMLIPYALVLSGALQQTTGHRLLWFLRHRPLKWLVALNALSGIVWLSLGSHWVLRVHAACDPHAAALLAASSMFVWVTLLGMSTAWVVLILAPCLALCRLDLGFALISFMSGIHRQPPGCARYTLLEEGRASR